MLDLSAAFDTVDHTILLRWLKLSFRFHDASLAWFRSYLGNRRQYMVYHDEETSHIQFGVPQGTVLGPLLFVLCTADVYHIVRQCDLNVYTSTLMTRRYTAAAALKIHQYSVMTAAVVSSSCSH